MRQDWHTREQHRAKLRAQLEGYAALALVLAFLLLAAGPVWLGWP